MIMKNSKELIRNGLIILSAIVLIIILMFLNKRSRPDLSSTEEVNEKFEWVAIPNIGLTDIVGICFDGAGINGAAVSQDGQLLITKNGGKEWFKWLKAPLQDGELVGGIAIDNNGGIVVGTGVDESSFTSFYTFKNKWEQASGDFGGIAGASSDGQFMVGGSGLVAQNIKGEWEVSKIPVCNTTTFYSVANYQNRVVAVGGESIVAESDDNGSSWDCTTLTEEVKYPLYKVVIAGKCGLIGGSKNNLWLNENHIWKKVNNLDLKSGNSFFALYLSEDCSTAFAGGGADSGSNPFILYSNSGGKHWLSEKVSTIRGRIIGFAEGQEGMFAASIDGKILIRRSLTIG